MSSLKSGSPFNPCDTGFLIEQSGQGGLEFMMPRFVTKKANNAVHLIPYDECLYIYAMDITYKFQTVEEFNTDFSKSRKYTATYFKIFHMKEKPWFKNDLEKLALTNKKQFMKDYYNQLKNEIADFNSFSAQQLKQEALNELKKIGMYL